MPTFQENNLGRIFDALDTTADGVLSADDVTAHAEHVASLVVPDAEAERRPDVVAAYQAWWRQIERDADTDHDGRVSRQDFVETTARGLRNDPDLLEEAYTPVARTVFEVLDRDHDGKIDQAGYTGFFAALGIGSEVAGAAFGKIDADGDGRIEYGDFRAAMQDLFTTSDPEAPGAAALG